VYLPFIVTVLPENVPQEYQLCMQVLRGSYAWSASVSSMEYGKRKESQQGTRKYGSAFLLAIEISVWLLDLQEPCHTYLNRILFTV
jgi:hypothetical protein